MSYEPQPGTIAYRAIAWLKLQPAGTEVTASMWAEGIGNCDGATLIPCIGSALTAGLIKRATRDGMQRPFWYSLGNGNPATPKVPADEDTRDPLPARRVAPEIKPRAGEVLPGLKVPKFSEVLKRHRELDAHEVVLGDVKLVSRFERTPAEVQQLREEVERTAAAAGMNDAQRLPFNACRYIDGSVIVVGVEVRSDGAIIFSPKQAASLWRLMEAA